MADKAADLALQLLEHVVDICHGWFFDMRPQPATGSSDGGKKLTTRRLCIDQDEPDDDDDDDEEDLPTGGESSGGKAKNEEEEEALGEAEWRPLYEVILSLIGCSKVNGSLNLGASLLYRNPRWMERAYTLWRRVVPTAQHKTALSSWVRDWLESIAWSIYSSFLSSPSNICHLDFFLFQLPELLSFPSLPISCPPLSAEGQSGNLFAASGFAASHALWQLRGPRCRHSTHAPSAVYALTRTVAALPPGATAPRGYAVKPLAWPSRSLLRDNARPHSLHPHSAAPRCGDGRGHWASNRRAGGGRFADS